MNPIAEAEDVGIRFTLERQERALVRDVILRPFSRSYSSGEFWGIRGVSFRLERGQGLGVIGGNGAGKTTLLMSLAGIYAPDEGRVKVRGRVASLLEVGAGFRWELTGRENVFLYAAIMGIPRGEVQRSFDEIVDFAGVAPFIDTPLRTYSSGMRMRLGFAIALNVRPDLLLVDEALSIGDSAFQNKAAERIEAFRKQGGSIVYVSHDMTSVGDICDQCLLLDKGRSVKLGETLDVIATYWERIWGTEAGETARSQGTPGDADLRGARRWGSGEYQIVGFSLFDSAGGPARSVEQGSELHVEMHFRASEGAPGHPLFQVSLFQGKRTVAVLRSDPAACRSNRNLRDGKVRLRIDTSPLPPGDYQFDAEIRDEEFTRMYDHLDKFISLEISQPSAYGASGTGLQLPCQWVFFPGDGKE